VWEEATLYKGTKFFTPKTDRQFVALKFSTHWPLVLLYKSWTEDKMLGSEEGKAVGNGLLQITR
jgi:hypothetical protein